MTGQVPLRADVYADYRHGFEHFAMGRIAIPLASAWQVRLTCEVLSGTRPMDLVQVELVMGEQIQTDWWSARVGVQYNGSLLGPELPVQLYVGEPALPAPSSVTVHRPDWPQRGQLSAFVLALRVGE